MREKLNIYKMIKKNSWCFWIDRGGTFTDVVAKDPSGKVVVKKYLSVNKNFYKDASSFAIREMLKEDKRDISFSDKINEIKMGTTIATNALLEKKGEKTILVTTKGFKDCLEIGYQSRPNIFSKKPEKTLNLYEHVLEIDERIDGKGKIIKKLDIKKTEKELI